MLNKFNLPSLIDWIRFLGWFFIKIIASLFQFILVCLENFLKFSLWCTYQIKEFVNRTVFVIDNLPFAGIPISRYEKQMDNSEKELPAQPIKVKLFDFTELRNNPDQFPHIRVIGKTGVGKTKLTEWLMDLLQGEQFIITPKKKPKDWINHKVYGAGFDYISIEKQLIKIRLLMYKRYEQIDKGIEPHLINFVCDEWKLINQNITRAKQIMKDIIVVARDSKIRLIALAQGENVATWGFEGESDLEECFTSIRLGIFATAHCKSLINKYRKGSDDYNYYCAVLTELEQQGHRCCMVDEIPAKVPNLSNWQPSFKSIADSFNSNNNSLNDDEFLVNSDSKIKPHQAADSEWICADEDDENQQKLSLENRVKSAILEGRSVDWCVKNIPELTGSYKSKREVVERIINSM